jgi:hypothetical protein
MKLEISWLTFIQSVRSYVCGLSFARFSVLAISIQTALCRAISKRATPRNGMTKPGNFDPAICTLKSSGQILIGLAYTWSASTRLLGHGKVTTGWLWHDQALIRLTAF